MELAVPTDRRDRLLAALLADDPSLALLRWDPGVAVLLVTSEPRRIVVLTVPEDMPPDRLREAFATHVKTVQQGSPPTHFVAVGGGPEVAAALREAAPFVEAVRLGFHHVDADGRVVPRTDEILPQQVDELLEVERPELDKLQPTKDWVRTQAARRVTLGARPALRVDHDIKDTRVQTYLNVVGGREVVVRGYARKSRPKTWEGLEEKVAGSLAAP